MAERDPQDTQTATAEESVVAVVGADEVAVELEHEVAPGEEVGRFVVERLLGTGGMGVVYGARDPRLRRTVALKLVNAAAHPAGSQFRVLREAQAMARVSHPNVVGVYEAGVWRDRVFVAMELVDGHNLRDWLAQRAHEPVEIWRMFAQAARGLIAVHAAGIVHRDFKPSNVLVGSDGVAKVTDFGIAAIAGLVAGVVPGGDQAPLAHTVSRVAGTPAYMAPEQLLGGRVDARTDEFGFCVALLEALTGAHPFGEGTVGERLRRILAGDVETGSSSVPAAAVAALKRGLRHDPAERFASMSALTAALDGAFGQTTFERDSHDALRAVWSDAQRAALERDAHAIDQVAAAWIEARSSAMLDTHVRRVQPLAVLERRLGELEVVREEIAALAARLATATDEPPAGALRQWARDRTMLCRSAVADELPVDALVPASLVVDLARATAARLCGAAVEARALARGVADRAVAIGAHPASARAHRLLADLACQAGDSAAARSAFETALLAAADCRDADMLATTWAAWAHATATGVLDLPPDQACYIAGIAVTRARGRAARAIALATRSEALAALGRHREAERDAHEAARLERSLQPEAPASEEDGE